METGRAIYVVRADVGCVKVGIASNPWNRLATLQSANHLPLHMDFIGRPSGMAEKIEQRVHSFLNGRRLSGEWYACSVDLAIGSVIQAAMECDVRISEVDVRNTVIRKNQIVKPTNKTPSDLYDLLELLGWSRRHLARVLQCDHSLVQRWIVLNAAPSAVMIWLARLAYAHIENLPPRADSWRSFG